MLQSVRTRSRVVTVFLAMVIAAAIAAVRTRADEPRGNATSQPAFDIERTVAMLEGTSRVFESVAKLVGPAVICIDARMRDENGKLRTEESGSGVLVRPSGFAKTVVVTNLHVVGDAALEDIDVVFANGRLLNPTRIWSDEQTDLALLELDGDDLPAARMGDSDDVRIGQWVLTIGSPFGLTQSVTHGIISAKHRRRIGMSGKTRIKEFLQTDAPINPGNSGGPLVNLKGEVIGINTAIASFTGSNTGVGFSIPINLVRWVSEELLTHGRVRRGFLGVTFAGEFTIERARQLGLDVIRGALVSTIYPRTPAENAGLHPGDVILAFDGRPIDDEHHLINVVSQTPIGKSVEVIVWRDGRRSQARVKLGSWDSFEQATENINIDK